MTIFEFRSKILTGEIVIQLYEYDHSLSYKLIRGCKSFNGQLEELEVGTEEL
jgi:hypothetical protein